uniref:Uncharacterized protein n=1 Tax=Romanomermis culicivorax TaxID=13658 RepID=A0A915L496_ROMCU
MFGDVCRDDGNVCRKIIIPRINIVGILRRLAPSGRRSIFDSMLTTINFRVTTASRSATKAPLLICCCRLCCKAPGTWNPGTSGNSGADCCCWPENGKNPAWRLFRRRKARLLKKLMLLFSKFCWKSSEGFVGKSPIELSEP